MESTKNNNNGGDQHQHQELQGGMRKRKLNEMTIDEDEDKPAAVEDDQDCTNSKKSSEDGNDLELELENMSRVELIKLVRKQKGMTMEAQKQMEAAKKETEGSQQKVKELTSEMAKLNAEYQKLVEFSNTTMNLPHPHRKLPAELNREIFYCFKLATRRKFICRLGWGFYAMFRQILLKKSKRLCNPVGNVCNRSNRDVTISEDGLMARNNTNGWEHIYAEKGFPISGANCRVDDFPGTICYYYEVKIFQSDRWFAVGLTDGEIPRYQRIGFSPNSYAICFRILDANIYLFRLAGQLHLIEFPEGVIRPELKETGNVVGCGILMNPNDKLTIFFTVNGILIGRQFPIDPTVDRMVPSVIMWDGMSVEANFGDNPTKPFEFDIKKCPGMGLEWI